MKKTLFLLLVIALMLLVAGCSADEKDDISGTYQGIEKRSDNFFIVFEKTKEEKEYKMMDIDVKENSDEENIFSQEIVMLDTREKNTRIITTSGRIIGEYSYENGILSFPNNRYKKIADRKLNAEEMKNHVTKY